MHSSRAFWGFMVAVIALGTGCEAPGSLVEATSWRLGTGADDPFTDGPGAADCGSGVMSIETAPRLAVELDTTVCDYVVITQPTGAKLGKNHVLEVDVGHGPLVADVPAEAHLAVAIGEHVVFDERIAIPSDANTLSRSVALGEEVPEGTPVVVHLHNHGDNTWAIYDVRGVEP